MPTAARSTDPMVIARDSILAPSGLDESRLGRVFGQVMSHAVDYADLYFQLAHEESWALEDSIVKEGSAATTRWPCGRHAPDTSCICPTIRWSRSVMPTRWPG
jgi:hypothetical protein